MNSDETATASQGAHNTPASRAVGPAPTRVFDQASIVAIVLDTSLKVARFNRAAERLFGLAAADVIGRQYAEVLEPLRRVNGDGLFERALNDRAPAEAREVEIHRPDGQAAWFDFNIDPVIGDDQALAGISVIGLDSTERTLLRRRLSEQNRDLLSLQSVSNALRTTQDLDRALLIIASALTSGESGLYQRVMLFVVDENRENLCGTVCVEALPEGDGRGVWRGLTSAQHPPGQSLEQSLGKTQPALARRWAELTEMIRTVRIPLTDEANFLVHALRTAETRTHDSHRGNPRPLPPQLEPGHSYAMAPLLADRECIGLLVVLPHESAHAFSREQLTMLEMLASQAALAVSNAQKYRSLMERAQRDSLTRLYNHGHFQEVLRAETERAERFGQQISLVLIDIDHFKAFNDRYGHQTGDKVLRQTALLLNSLVRVSDVAARYGGEEFAILLPQTPYEAAVETAERLRDGIARKATVIGPKGQRLTITASFGVANFPRHARNASELVFMADEALYLAKEHGRNRVYGADSLGDLEDATATAIMPRNRGRRTSNVTHTDTVIPLKGTPTSHVPRRRSTRLPRKSGKQR